MNDNAKAASILRQYAGELYQGHTIGGEWECAQIEAQHDEMMALADRLALADAGGAAVPVAWLRKNGFRFNGDIEPQDDSELPLYPAHPDSDRVAELESHIEVIQQIADNRRDMLAATEQQLTESREREGRMRAYGEQLLDAIDEPPDANCSCHLSPPCSDCVDYGYLREAIRDFKAALAADKEKK